MIFISSKSYIDICKTEKAVSILLICPICKSEKTFPIDKSIIKQEKLTTVSIPSGICCNHSFQAFIDNQLKVRGYQKNDFEFMASPIPKIENNNKINFPKDDLLFKNLILNENFVEYRPIFNNKNNTLSTKEENSQCINEENTKREKLRRLKKIYDEFWEFINEDNEIFKDFIIKDPRRQQLKQTMIT